MSDLAGPNPVALVLDCEVYLLFFIPKDLPFTKVFSLSCRMVLPALYDVLLIDDVWAWVTPLLRALWFMRACPWIGLLLIPYPVFVILFIGMC